MSEKPTPERVAVLETQMKEVLDTQDDHAVQLKAIQTERAKNGGIAIGLLAAGAALGGHMGKVLDSLKDWLR